MRLLMLALVASALIVFSATFVSRAVDAEVQDRIMFTRNGQTLDCARLIVSGEVSYGDCNRVP